MNKTAIKRGFHWNPITQSLGIHVNGVQVADYSTIVGRIYYVNNILGSSSSDGLSWGTAFDQVETAVAASETYRQLGGVPGGAAVTTNDFVRNTIIVQGTGTAYTAVTSIPNYVDIIGLGADPRGNGTGIAQIDGAGVADCISISSAGCRGLFMANMQLDQSSAGGVIGLDAAKLFRSRLEGCAFTNQGTSGIRIVLGGGVYINDCACTNDTFAQITGLTLGNGATVNGCKITNSEFFGDTQGVSFTAVAGKQTVFRDCMAIGGTKGFVDSTSSDVGAQPWYVRCYGFGTNNTTINQTGFVLSSNFTKRSIGCLDNANGTVRNYPTTTD
ncbi:hypothetical protein LCGC14_2078950 [marine sediment metagenome]|uniref:Right handed beta helix domain-containing protein n=1 Tax=marine sediment metagenome TaxID=412755 RepID=A0A0F9GUJ3_9ZZZZ